MSKRMLIDATHAEETRVVVMDSSRLVEYDVEVASKKQLKGNIYLARVVRVEPSLQAAFVEYGGNRHGFLAFGEIHPDYYQIPVADRQRLLELQEQEAREQEQAEEAELHRSERTRDDDVIEGDAIDSDNDSAAQPASDQPAIGLAAPVDAELRIEGPEVRDDFPQEESPVASHEQSHAQSSAAVEPAGLETATPENNAEAPSNGDEAVAADSEQTDEKSEESDAEADAEDARLETIGGEHDTSDDAAAADRRSTSRLLRQYKIQEVIRRRQVLLVQVVKEERGTKGAALTTYISLAGRYSVLMPNSPRGGGVSRKITAASDRRRLKEITQELELPRGMGIIIRTAGASRPKPEIKRDGETLLTLWDDIRERTLQSMAPALIHEEASLIKRALRDSYSGDVEEVLVDGENGWRAARDFMRLMMPSHARKVSLWRETSQSLFSKYQVESHLDAMLNPTVQLRSGGYLVINQTEALVAIDVNSGRSTRERGIEETALRTNLEAAEEVARQLRLRDLAGLIVIDFIDMESRRNNSAVERRMKEALASDRARIQLGQISHFGLMEMSRQRLRPSLTETSFVSCSHCGGIGLVRSTESAALHVLRALEEEGAKRRSGEILVHVASPVILYILNHKRDRLTDIEGRCGMQIVFQPDNSLPLPQLRIDRVRPYVPHIAPMARVLPEDDFVDAEIDAEAEEAEASSAAQPQRGGSAAGDEDPSRRRRRRRRRGGRGGQNGDQRRSGEASGDDGDESDSDNDDDTPENEDGNESAENNGAEIAAEALDGETAAEPASSEAQGDADQPQEAAPRRRGRRPSRRGGRRNTETDEESAGSTEAEPMAEQAAQTQAHTPAPKPAPQPAPQTVHMRPAYNGPTPADPFGGSAGFDIFDALEQASMQSEQAVKPAENTQVIQPTVVDESLAPPPKRRSWWRRG